MRAMRIVLSGVSPSQLEEAVLGQRGSEEVTAFPTPISGPAAGTPPPQASATAGSAGPGARRTLASGLIQLSFNDTGGPPEPELSADNAAPSAPERDMPPALETGHSLLVTPKLRALVRQLLLFRDAAEGASTAAASAERQPERNPGTVLRLAHLQCVFHQA